jgi:hypothetical protein
VPFEALTAFADPCAEFGLRFQQLEADLTQPSVAEVEAVDSGAAEGAHSNTTEHHGKVVQIEDFRR